MKIDFLPFKNLFFKYMVKKINVFYNYLSGENFALILNSNIWKLTFYHLKTFFYYMVIKQKVFITI